VIETFVSRPNWAPPILETGLIPFYQLLKDVGFKANTIGKSQVALKSPFEDVRRLMKRCQCTIVLGLPQIFVHSGSIKHVPIESNLMLPTEWNQIEATMSLMMDLPTLVLLHNSVSDRGLFYRGAADVFVYDFDITKADWLDAIRPGLDALRAAVES
jgi:hypothetical protein